MEPTTLQDAIVYFADPANCREYLIARRWPNGVICPRCGSANVLFQQKYNRWQCGSKHALRQFTLKTGTIFEDSPLGLDKWLMAMWQVVNCKNGISSYEVHRGTGITQKTAWFMDHRIRHALGLSPVGKLSGQIEADETFIGGRARNMHAHKRAKKITARGSIDPALDSRIKRDWVEATWAKVNFDRQIVAIAKVEPVSALYSTDNDVHAFAKLMGVPCFHLADLPLPAEDPQMNFAYQPAADSGAAPQPDPDDTRTK
jgi:transposase-like protein